jgi:hypothetical protein
MLSTFAGGPTRAPVSSDQKGRETPAGIFSVIQKEAELPEPVRRCLHATDAAHHSVRHCTSRGPLPGFLASHGRLRMPYRQRNRPTMPTPRQSRGPPSSRRNGQPPKAELQPKFDAVKSAREAAVAAETARVVAGEAARKVALDLEPASVFFSQLGH